MIIEQIDPKLLRPNERNSRIHSAEQVADIARSITEFGWTLPILIDENNTILAGHGRQRAALSLGSDAIPCRRLVGLTDEQKRAYVIADNQIALGAEWDEAVLRLELHDLQAADFDLGMLGFTDDVLADLLKGGEEPGTGGGSEGLTDPDDVPPLPVRTVSVTGDVWVLGGASRHVR